MSRSYAAEDPTRSGHNTTASFWRIMAGIFVIGATLAEDFATLGFGARNDYASVMLGLQLIFSD